MTSSRTALIIGGGIAGPAAAAALEQSGIHSRLFEAAPEHEPPSGMFLNLTPGGVSALKAIGAAERVCFDGVATPRIVLHSGRGKQLGEVANGPPSADGQPSLTVMRETLRAAVVRAARDAGAELSFGKRLVDVVPYTDGVVALFGDGSEEQGAFLIGADGVRSRTRRILDTASPSPGYTGMLRLGGVAAPTGEAPTPETMHIIYGRRAFFGYQVLMTGDALWFANIRWRRRGELKELPSLTAGEWKDRLLELFDGDAGPMRPMLLATDGPIGMYPLYDMAPAAVWRRGPVALIGDAVHPTSPNAGLGPSLALEDAVTLAACLGDADALTAFGRFEQLRRQRVERLVSRSRRLSYTTIIGSDLGIRLRDALLPVALRLYDKSASSSGLYVTRTMHPTPPFPSALEPPRRAAPPPLDEAAKPRAGP